jgi:type IV secretion system protein VirB10
MRLAALVLFLNVAYAAEIPQGAHVGLRMVNSVSTRTAKEGDYVYMTTATPIVAGGRVVVPVGSYVQGIVTRSVRSGRVSGKAELSIRIETMTLASGTVVQIAPHLQSVDSEGTEQTVDSKENQVKQGASKGTDAAKVATLGGTGAAIGGMADRSWKGAGIGAGAGAGVGLATVLLTRGKEVDLRQGTMIDVVFDKPVAVE